MEISHNEPGAEEMAKKISKFITPESGLKRLVIGLESTSFYGVHLANYLSTCRELMPFHTEVYCLNPKSIANYKKSYIGLLVVGRITKTLAWVSVFRIAATYTPSSSSGQRP